MKEKTVTFAHEIEIHDTFHFIKKNVMWNNKYCGLDVVNTAKSLYKLKHWNTVCALLPNLWILDIIYLTHNLDIIQLNDGLFDISYK